MQDPQQRPHGEERGLTEDRAMATQTPRECVAERRIACRPLVFQQEALTGRPQATSNLTNLHLSQLG